MGCVQPESFVCLFVRICSESKAAIATFETQYDSGVAEGLRSQWLAGDFSQSPSVEVGELSGFGGCFVGGVWAFCGCSGELGGYGGG